MTREVVGFLLDVEEGTREVHDCETCTRPKPAACESCPLAQGLQPEVPGWLAFYLGLHKRVKRYGQLPDPGGLLDQDERTMKILDRIEETIEERQRKKRKKAEAEMKRNTRARRV